MCEPHFAPLKCGILEVCCRDTAYGVPHGRDESDKPANVHFNYSCIGIAAVCVMSGRGNGAYDDGGGVGRDLCAAEELLTGA
jgi:hypothetical protein